MLVLAQGQIRRWPVKVDVPKDGGGWETQELVGHFRLLPQSRIDALVGGAREDGEVVRDQDVIAEVLAGWDGVSRAPDADGAQEPISLAELLDMPGVRAGLVRAWLELISGGRRGNS